MGVCESEAHRVREAKTSIVITHARTRARAISCAPLLRKPPDRIARQQNMVLASDGLSDRTVDVKEVFEQTIQNAEARNGKWYANASPQVRAKLCAAYEAEPYPSEKEMKKLASALKAPSPACIATFLSPCRSNRWSSADTDARVGRALRVL